MASESQSKSTEAAPPSSDNVKMLPVLIIPGFMSSGLEIKQSTIKRGWENKRLWLSLESIGISSLYFGKATERTVYSRDDLDDEVDKEEVKQYECKSAWLQHMMLDGDRESDPPGIKVRNISGLEGVDYLTPGAFTNTVSYVFGPVIKALEEKGYNSGRKPNLMASPYDWRLAPSDAEKRDEYYKRTLGYIEELFNNNDSTKVVLLCHSLGSRVGHYLLNYALDTKGQDWIDKYVHTYMVSRAESFSCV